MSCSIPLALITCSNLLEQEERNIFNLLSRRGCLLLSIRGRLYLLSTGEFLLFEIKLDLETETTKQVQIVINGGDLVLHGEHLLLNAYDIKLFQSGGVIRHTLNGLLK